MQTPLFNILITDNVEMITEMNRFLAGNRVLEVGQKFYQNENGAWWGFCVQ
jgi:hypothetical protein